MPGLFDPITIRGITCRNRIGVAPMVQTSSIDGFATDWHLVHLGTRAVGGAGLVLTEATAVEADGRISINDLGIWHDDHIPGLQRITDFLRREGAVPGIQLGHAGRKASYGPPFDQHGIVPMKTLSRDEGGWPVKGASPIAFDHSSLTPREMSHADIQEVIAAFVAAARRSEAAGFDWIEVHAAHGYLLHSFCSPLSNSRQDEYGGCFENRIRLMRETARAIRTAWPEHKPLSFRLSYTDWVEGGWCTEDAVKLAECLKQDGVDIIDASSGGSTIAVAMMRDLVEKESANGAKKEQDVAVIPIGPGYQVPGAEAIRKGADILVAAVGLITEPEQADAIIRNGQADMVMMARELLRNPYWPQHAAKQLGQLERVRLPIQYYMAWRDQKDLSFEPVAAPYPGQVAESGHRRLP